MEESLVTKATILTSPPQYEHSRGSISYTLRSRRAQLMLRRRVLFPVLAVVDYYEMAERIIGDRAATQDFYRLFMIPGRSHW